MEIIFCSGTNNLGLGQYVNECLVWHQTFGPSQNILGRVEGQGISLLYKRNLTFLFLRRFAFLITQPSMV